jgi:hypothetical protein
MEFQRDDILGPRADRATVDNSIAYHELMAMEGLIEVKQEINKLLDMVMQNALRLVALHTLCNNKLWELENAILILGL